MKIRLEITSLLKRHLGLSLLSISIVTGCLILVNYFPRDLTTYHVPNNYENKIKLSGELGSSLNINTNANDVTYHSKYTLADGEALVVQLSNGTTEKIQGKNIVATFYHVAKFLLVQSEEEGKNLFRYYNAPIKWESAK